MVEIYTRRVVARIKHADGHYGAPTWALVGDTPSDHEAIAKAPLAPLKTAISAPRDQGRHRFYWKLLSVVHDNLPDQYPMTLETLHDVVKMGAGCVRVVRLPNNVLYELPGSIAFGKMDENEFQTFIDRAIKYIVSDLIPGMDSEALEGEVLEMMR